MGDLWLHPRAQHLPGLPMGPFARRPDGAWVGITDDGLHACVSHDRGESWEQCPLFTGGETTQPSRERALICSRDGTLVLAFMDLSRKVWTWTDESREITAENQLPTCTIRSLDGGRTWQDLRTLHLPWTGAIRTMIQTRDGALVFTSMMMVPDPARHIVLTYSSRDDGLTWTRSNLIDLGGSGHHGGATEPAVAELEDGRLWLLIRTNWQRFWEAFSEDGGVSWRTIQPTEIDASPAPAQLLRLASGRLLMAWNRLYPEGRTNFPLSGGDGIWSEVPVPNHREELSIALSQDDAESWGDPVVIARHPGSWLSYPYLFEPTPGEVILTTMQGNLRLRFRESTFLDGVMV